MTGLIWANDIAAMLETGCSYTQATVDSLGAVVEQFIQAELDMNNLPVNPANTAGSGVGMLMVASQNWLCRDIRIMQKHDGTIPNSLSAGPHGKTLLSMSASNFTTIRDGTHSTSIS